MIRSVFLITRTSVWSVMALLLMVIGCVQGDSRRQLSQGDLEAIRSASLAYPEAWLSNEPDRVRATLADDPVLMPSGGMAPVEGLAAINDFFWPADAPPMTVTEYIMEPAEVAGRESLAYVRGAMKLTFQTASNDNLESYSTSGTYLMILRPDANRAWKISRFTWNHPPWQLVASEPLPSQ